MREGPRILSPVSLTRANDKGLQKTECKSAGMRDTRTSVTDTNEVKNLGLYILEQKIYEHMSCKLTVLLPHAEKVLCFPWSI